MTETAFVARPLTVATWDDFATLVEAHGGIFGGCWCLGFHDEANTVGGFAVRRETKRSRVEAGTAHAALVYAGELCVGWCQFGSPGELPHIKNRKLYVAGAGAPPDWRITCFFVHRSWRKRGVARAALMGALDQMGSLGGGLVEAYPEDTGDRRVTPVAVHGGSLALLESAGFERIRMIGKNKWVVSRAVASTAPDSGGAE